jgi:trimeric autotransporter adhesin
MFKSVRRLSPRVLLPLCLLLFSCGTQRNGSQLAIPAGRHGLVHGGQQPVTGSTIQLYAVGTTGDGSASTPLLSPAPVSDADGGFNISGTYSCPSSSSLVYIVASGGNPGLPPGTNNGALSLMAALGPCGNLSASTFIIINELTTVAAVYSLAPYMTSPSAVGSAPGDAAALAGAFTLASQLANTATGTTPGTGVPTGTSVPVAQINTIGDIVASCINSAGGASGDTTPCGTLFSLTTPTGLTPATNTVTALLHLANNPTLNTASLYNLVTPGAPFQPTQPQTPPDLSVRLTVPSGFTASTAELDFPATRVGFGSGPASPPQTVTFTNNTGTPVGINIAAIANGGAAISGANPLDFLGFNSSLQTCATPVMPGATCSLQFVFTPTGIGARSAYLTVSNTSANPMISILMTGVGLEANAGPAYLNPALLNLTAAGSPTNTTLTNSGTLPLTIDGISISNDPTSGQPAFTQTNNCGTSLAPQATCTIAVTALPTQPYSTGVLTVGDDANAGPQTTALSYSNGFSGPIKFDFGSRSLGTQGTGPLDFVPPGLPGLYNLTLTGPNATDFSFQSDSSSQSSSCLTSRIGPYCGPTIYFTPSALGLRTATLNLNGVPYGGVIGVGLTTGMHFSVLQQFGGGLAPSSVDFGFAIIGHTSPATVVNIVNTGTVPITFNAPVLSGPNPSDFNAVSNCTTLAPNGTCTLSITASPTQPVNQFANLTLMDSTAAVQQTLSLKVLGINPPPVANPTTINFAYTPLGTVSAPQSFTVTSFNNDPVSAQVVDGQFLPFFVTQGGSCSVTPCQISVVFAPTTANTATAGGVTSYGNLLVTDLLSGQGAVVSLSGVWQPPPPPTTTASILPGVMSFNPQSVGTTSMTQSISITNTGNQPLINQISLTGNNPQDYILTNPCPSTIAIGGFCNLTVAFSPTATGLRSANVNIIANTSNFASPIPISITGTGQ